MSDGISNARGWAATILEGITALRALESDDSESVVFDGEEFDSADNLRERLEEKPLSLQVRSGWYRPGDRDGIDAKPEEFEILLSTGGPALRIIGRLDEYGQVYGTPDLQWQDWGTPWTHAETTEEQESAIAEFAGLFWYGE